MLDVRLAKLVVGAVALDHLGDRLWVARADEIEPFIGTGPLNRVVGRVVVRGVWLHVVEVHEERALQLFQLAEYSPVDAIPVLLHTALDKAIESATKTAFGVEFAWSDTDDGALRYRDREESVVIENLGGSGKLCRYPEMSRALPGKDVRLA
jgi:hypothetical protein